MDNIAFKDATQPMPIDICTSGASCPAIAAPNYLARKVVAYYKWSGLSGTTWDDNHGHGTHVGGSIIGNDNGFNPGTSCTGLQTPDGTSNLVGMAPYAKLVMQVVIEDYVHAPLLAATAHLANIFTCALLAIAGVLAVLRIALGA